jgi:SAM-dependent methyltransferase
MTTPEPTTSAHVRRNREHWETRSDDYQAWNREQLNARWGELGWGVWDLPDRDLQVLGDVEGLDALEYGCGACQSGIKVAMLGARVTGLDFSASQLAEGRRNMEATGVRFSVVQGDGERVPFADESFDLVWCDHGIMSFADPYRTVPEVARVLRPGGRFAFSIVSPWAWVTTLPDDDHVSRELKQPYFGMHAQDVNDPEWRTTEFQLTYGDWIRLFGAQGLVVDDLLELRPEPDAVSTYVDPEELPWARDYPIDHIWKVRKG